MPHSMRFAHRVKELRLSQNLSLREVQKITGISNPYLSQIERGLRGIPSLQLILKLEKAYKLKRKSLCLEVIKWI